MSASDPRAGSRPAVDTAGRVRVMTFNILCETAAVHGGWASRRPIIERTLREQAPDVAGLQEVAGRQGDDLVAALPEYAFLPGPSAGESAIAVGWVKAASSVALAFLVVAAIAAGRGIRGAPPAVIVAGLLGLALLAAAAAPFVLYVLSRLLHGGYIHIGGRNAVMFRRDRFRLAREGAFWVSNAPEREGSILPGNYAPHVVHWARLEPRAGGTPLTIFVAHLGHGPWTWPAVARILRAQLDELWDGTPQFLVGDFNATPSSGLLRRLRAPSSRPDAPPLLDAWREAEAREGPESSFHWMRGFRAWPGRIDFILVRPRVRITRAVIPAAPPGVASGSDHDPVVVEMELPAET